MNYSNYTAIHNKVKSEELGDIKAIRIFKLVGLEEKITFEVLKEVLKEDVDFAIKVLGVPTKILSKTVNYEKSIIILEHTNKKTTHISINLYNKEIFGNFKIEVVGSKGILEYDSAKNSPIVLSDGNNKNITSIENLEKINYDEKVYSVLEDIFKSLKLEV
ncbi:MAG: hypothetical protein ACK5LY_08200 [Lachnospirales bacterium]